MMCKKNSFKMEACQERFRISENVPVYAENKDLMEETEILPKAFEDYIQRRRRQMKLERLAMLRPLKNLEPISAPYSEHIALDTVKNHQCR